MSSSRLPGKMLMPIAGIPLIDHVLERIPGMLQTVLLTTTRRSDDPLVCYVEHAWRSVGIVRGTQHEVWDRYLTGYSRYPSSLFVRICGDSPLVDPTTIMQAIVAAETSNADVVTTCFPQREFPKGQNVEVFRTEMFLSIDPASLTKEEQEHIGPYFYNRPDMYKIEQIQNVRGRSLNPPWWLVNDCAVDTLEDLRRIEREYFNG